MTQHLSKSIIVNIPAQSAFGLWADFTQFPKFMAHVKSVTIIDERMSHWVAAGPMGTNIDWNAEITRLEPNVRIAWNTKDNQGFIATSGQVTFNPLPNSQTEVTVTMQYSTPGGKLGDLAANILSDPEKSVAADLRRFKAHAESQVLAQY